MSNAWKRSRCHRKIYMQNISGKRKVRRPKSRRLDKVNEGARKEGIMWWMKL